MPPLRLIKLCPCKTLARVPRLALLAALLSGCGGSGPEVAPVSGRVTLDGAPLAGARIKFQPEASGGSPSYGAADQEGNYVLGYKRGQPGALIGWHTVQIERGAGGDPGNKSKLPPLPARYNSASELREEVKAGEDNVIEFDLTSNVE
jgi:hypothetical protein